MLCLADLRFDALAMSLNAALYGGSVTDSFSPISA
jgi:hypothetical protein